MVEIGREEVGFPSKTLRQLDSVSWGKIHC